MDKYQKELELVYDLIKLAKQSKMAFKHLDNDFEVIPIANIDDEPVFNQEDLTFHPNGKCGCISVGDDYIFGIRCEHLIWFEGNCEGLESFWTEKDCTYPTKCDNPLNHVCHAIMICGNHKGNYQQKLIVFHEK